MIAHIFGIVAEKLGNTVIVDVHGVGYEIQVSSPDFEKTILNESVKFYTYHHIREQSQELFGFYSLAAKKLFELLITVQGIGPKAALAILSLGESEAVRNAIANGDSVFVAKASGVGKKIAERVVVDLSDKVGVASSLLSTDQALSTAGGASTDEALEALMALGYNLHDAVTALEKIPTNLSTAERVTLALRG